MVPFFCSRLNLDRDMILTIILVDARSGSTWELRCGPGNCFRVFYEVDHAEHTVWVLAIGIKVRERLLIGGEEFGP